MGEAVIETRDLTKHYGATVGLESLDLIVERGEIFGLLGPNGAGKTTTIRLLLDLIRPSRGDARLFGLPTGEVRIRTRVGYLPGDLVLDGRLTGRRMLHYLDSLRPRGAVRPGAGRRAELCDRLGLGSGDLSRPVREYSRGMRQKLALVAALQHDPDLLILDEPTSGLDPLVREVVFDLLVDAARSGRTVLHSSHVLSEIDRTCMRVGVLREGRLVALERTEDLRRSAVRRVAVRFSEDVSAHELAELAGVEIVEHDGRSFSLRVSGAPGPLLVVLARHPVEQLTFPEPSVEEAFSDLYRGGTKRDPRERRA